MQINVAVKVGACESNQTNINITVRNGQGKRSIPGTGKRSTHGQGKRTSEFLQ
jgi:hypothetical protein